MVEQRAGVSAHDADRLSRMAKGAPGRACSWPPPAPSRPTTRPARSVRKLPDLDEGALLAMADTFRGAEGVQRFELLFERLADQIHAMATGMAGERTPAGLDRWVAAWEKLVRAPREAEALNLDRADAFWTALMDLRAAAGRPCDRMLIDSHVNLHAQQFDEDRQASDRPRPPGRGRTDGQLSATRSPSLETVQALAMAMPTSGARSAPIRTRPRTIAAVGRAAGRAGRPTRAWSASASAASISTTTSARATCRPRCSAAHVGGGAPDRPAAGGPHPRGRRR